MTVTMPHAVFISAQMYCRYMKKLLFSPNEWLRIRYQTSISGRFWLNNIHSYSEMLKHNRRGTATETYLDGFSIDWFIMEVSTTIV